MAINWVLPVRAVQFVLSVVVLGLMAYGCRLPISHGQLQILGLFRNAWLRCSAAEEEILEVPYKMCCMPDEAVLKHNRDMKCLERQTSAAMFDVIAPIPFVSIEQERSQRYKLSVVENSFVVVQACAREE
ncbi:hypothetical protein IG631_12887 [Alternaria alternata]|nr:hypothetical protein IG631_12887 [Alternaria alternata]